MSVGEGIVKLVDRALDGSRAPEAFSTAAEPIGELFSHTENNSPVTPIGGPR